MSGWKGSRRRDGDYRNDGRSNLSNSWRSPQWGASGTSSDLATEKEFCKYLSSITWGRLCHAQKYTFMYKNILQWDDSGALESFQSARSRFHAEHSDEPCDNPLPDPEMYIDEINHDCVIDPELIADLEKELETPETTKAKHRTSTSMNGWDSAECVDRRVPVTGWESWSDDKDKEKDNLNNWDAYIDNKPEECKDWGNSNWYDDPWERGNKETGWGNNCITSSAWEQREDSNNDGWNNDGWNNPWNNNNSFYRRNEVNNRNGRKRDGGVNNGGFKVRKVRYTGDRCHPGNNWRGMRGRNNRNSPYNAAFS